MENNVFISKCEDYNVDNINKSFKEILLDSSLLDFVKEGMVIAIKANLVTPSKPESAITTHPTLLIELCKILLEKKAKVIVGDSPGGLYNEVYLAPVYSRCNLKEIEKIGGSLNHDFSTSVKEIEGLKIIKHLDCCNWLLKADAIINFAKMKTHGMMSLSGSVKNMFGSVPGTIKLEYHYRYPSHQDFANMLIDIQEFYKCQLHIVDAILAMEGNGPTMGVPRHVGLLMASKSCYALDLVCCKLMNLDINNVFTVKEAINRNLCVDSVEKVNMSMNIDEFVKEDYVNIIHHNNIQFFDDSNKNFFKRIIGKLAKAILMVRPKAKKKECIGCRKCADICPAKAITMKNKKPVIDKNKCIRCFCCQEFCPVGAMKTHRTLIGKIITKKKSSSK